MRWQTQDMEIANKCMNATFRLMEEDGADIIEGVDSFNYLGRILHKLDDNCSEVLRKILKERQVWGSLGKLLRRADLFVSANFYRAVVQAVLLFGADTWVMTSAMSQKLEVVHGVFL